MPALSVDFSVSGICRRALFPSSCLSDTPALRLLGMYDGCSRMSLLLSKARVSQRVAGVNRYASNLKLVRTCGIAASRASPRLSVSNPTKDYLIIQRRHFSLGSKVK